MSTVDTPLSRLPALGGRLRGLAAGLLGAVAAAVRAVAFWAAIPLPLVVVGALLSGAAASAPVTVLGLMALNAVCAAVGQGHRTER